MTIREAAIQLVEIRKRWRNNGSSIEFNKAEGAIYNAFKASNPNWETEWPTVQLAAHKIVR